MELEVLPGTPGLTLAEVRHVLVPGRGRNRDGTGLNLEGEARCRLAVELAVPGRIVCSGYKSPIDHKGRAWTSPEGEVFQGIPEADLMRSWLLDAGVPPEVIGVERHSVDTVSNLLRSEHEGHFGGGQPVAIVAQRGHLSRILSVIAPRTLRRPYLGVVAPGEPRESPLAAPVSWLVGAALPRDARAAIAAVERRSRLLWRTAEHLGKRDYY
ncbi:hypothetical protein FB565_001484 [Actinoplanes lutulentus]|uniref:ElyC/SanA/YdcF family protein n=1 Tax=Actinoplanes lutulentus TaxID=1287878 RepID=UPI0015EC83B0|nr:ElyC/SanA/YdcF family protein [Actinoplanes lutulentus]MBB2941780.1 hypothetical protein [Actinoplanes lutulentus]